jgi:hypothetical protein
MTEKLNREAQVQYYLDGEGTPQERDYIEKMIATDPEWGSTYESFLDIHQMLSDNPVMEPSMRFTKNVMEEIEGLSIAKPIRQYGNPWVFRLAGGILVLFLLGIFIYLFSQIDFSQGSGSGMPNVLSNLDAGKWDWGRFAGGSANLVLYMLVTVMGCYLFDKIRKKKHSFSKEG